MGQLNILVKRFIKYLKIVIYYLEKQFLKLWDFVPTFPLYLRS